MSNAYEQLDVIRRKLLSVRTASTDEYQKQLERQNNGLLCEHCAATSGHFSVCPLINREVGEIKRIAEGGSLSEEDANILYALGVTW